MEMFNGFLKHLLIWVCGWVDLECIRVDYKNGAGGETGSERKKIRGMWWKNEIVLKNNEFNFKVEPFWAEGT